MMRMMTITRLLAATLLVATTPLFASALVASPIFETIRSTKSVLDPRTGQACDLRSDVPANKKSLVVFLPQLGEFDSAEFCQQLVAVQSNLQEANIELRVIGIGDHDKCCKRFSDFCSLPLDVLRVDPEATLHKELNLHTGPGWNVPDSISDDVLSFLLSTLPGGVPSNKNLLRPAAKAWLNYLAMCAGIGAPGTLREILRGYFGDATAPERLSETDIVEAGFVTIGPGVGPVQLGPLSYTQWWSDERGYQRPVELATVRLKNMVEILQHWDTYVSNPTTIDQRGATFLFDESGEMLYEYRHKGVLTYSETMARPLMFLAPYIGEEMARNPLGLPDDTDTVNNKKSGRGVFKPAGKFMNVLKPVFAWENQLQARLLGCKQEDFQQARTDIENAISSSHVVIYTYGLSPFSSQAIALLKEAGCTDYKKIELGLEWFLLGKEASAVRAELLSMTTQSSLPHVFIGGKHIGGLFSGTPEGGPGLAALQESGELEGLLKKRRKSLVN